MIASVPPKAGSLGPQVLHLLRTQIHRLGTSDVLALRELIECPSMISSEHHKQSLHALVGLGNGLDRYVTDSTIAMHCMLPLLIWAKPSDGAEHIVGRVPNWAIFHTDHPDADMVHARDALVMLNVLRTELTPAQVHCFAQYWQEDRSNLLWNNVYTRQVKQVEAWCDTVVQLGYLHAHAQTLPNAPYRAPGQAAPSQRWTRRLEQALSPMTLSQQTACSHAFLKSNLPGVYLLRACKSLSPTIWLNDQFQTDITPYLPVNEYARWTMLPLQAPDDSASSSVRINSAEDNRALSLRYCPEMSNILDTLIPQDEWSYKKNIDALMRATTKKQMQSSKPESLDLPALD